MSRTTCATLLTIAMLAGCGSGPGGSARDRLPAEGAEQQFLLLPRPPLVEADRPYDVTVARRILDTTSPGDLRRREGARIVGAESLAYLSGAAEGRAFLDLPAPRVLVRGRPAAFCPYARAQTATTALSSPDLAAEALETCLAARQRPGCGCQVVALGSIVLVPIEELAYATGMTARIRAPSAGIDGVLVAEETATGDLLLRDLTGIVGTLLRGEGDSVTLRLAGADRDFRGTARPVGFRRGRLAERIYLTDGTGARVSLLIGFEPDELADFAGGWLAWPPDT